MPELLQGSLPFRVGHMRRKKLLIIDFSSLPIDFRVEWVVLQETWAGNGQA
jgi:hypothetical protein